MKFSSYMCQSGYNVICMHGGELELTHIYSYVVHKNNTISPLIQRAFHCSCITEHHAFFGPGTEH